MKKTLVALSTTLILCGTLVWIANIAADTALSIKNKGYVTVKGFAKQEITSDLGIFEAGIRSENVDLKLAYQKLAGDRKRFKSFLEKYDIPESGIELFPVAVKEKFKITDRGYATDEFVHFMLSQDFRIESGDVRKVAGLSSEVADILNEGVKLRVSNPQYIYTGLEDLKIEMIGKATANAKARARTIASQGKFRLGNIASVRVGVFQITPANSTQVHDYGINDTTSIAKEIKSIVEVKYFVR